MELLFAAVQRNFMAYGGNCPSSTVRLENGPYDADTEHKACKDQCMNNPACGGAYIQGSSWGTLNKASGSVVLRAVSVPGGTN